MGISAPVRRVSAGALIGSAAAAILAAAPPPAAAATIAPTRSCYVNTQGAPAHIWLRGMGWEANQRLRITSAGGGIGLSGHLTTGAEGRIAGAIHGRYLGTGFPAAVGRTRLTATDPRTHATASSWVHISNRVVAITPTRARPSRKVRFTFTGFPGRRRIYAHYLHRGRLVLTYNFGRSAGPCAVHRYRARMYPRGHARFNRYLVKFDNFRHYRRHHRPLFEAMLTFSRR